MTTFALYQNEIPGVKTDVAPAIDYYPAPHKTTDATAVIFPGGGYGALSSYEGPDVAAVLNEAGMSVFVVRYRVAPAHFPAPLLDARRAMRFVRAHAEEFGIDPEKVLAVGGSAGGHLAALLSTYLAPLKGEGIDEMDALPYLPNRQALLYPVLSCEEGLIHEGSYRNLLGDELYARREEFSPPHLVTAETPPAFLFHTVTDSVVPVGNTYAHAAALYRAGVPCEVHVFPTGHHGVGVRYCSPYVKRWTELFVNWLIFSGYLQKEC